MQTTRVTRMLLAVAVFGVGVTMSSAQQNGANAGPFQGQQSGQGYGASGHSDNGQKLGSSTALLNGSAELNIFVAMGTFGSFYHCGVDVEFPQLSILVASNTYDVTLNETEQVFKAAPYEYLAGQVGIDSWTDSTYLVIDFFVNDDGEFIIVTLQEGDVEVNLRDPLDGKPLWQQGLVVLDDSVGALDPFTDPATVETISGTVTSVGTGIHSRRIRVRIRDQRNSRPYLVTIGSPMLVTLQGMEIRRSDRITAMIASRIHTNEKIMLQVQNEDTGESVLLRNKNGIQHRLHWALGE